MNAFLNFKNLPALALILASTALTAQTNIHSTATDVKYGNTTVIYTQTASTDDLAILSQLDHSYGIGDVVRITVAPPKPKQETVVVAAPVVKVAQTKPVPTVAPKIEKPATEIVAKPVKLETPAQPEAKKLKKESIYRLEKVFFDANKAELKTESEEQLAELYEYLKKHPEAEIEVRGHTNNLMWPNADFAEELSGNRAKAVADWLIKKGISAKNVKYKGYGWTMPLEPNVTPEGRKKNQRVDVKLLNLNN